MINREGVMVYGQEEEGQGQKVLIREDGPVAGTPLPRITLKQKHEIHELARNLKGAYVRIMRICKELDIPFSS